MNDRQQALLAYVMTIAGHVRGFKSFDDLTDRIMKCVREDAMFIAQGLATTVLQNAAQSGQNFVERKAGEIVGALARDFGSFLREKMKSK